SETRSSARRPGRGLFVLGVLGTSAIGLIGAVTIVVLLGITVQRVILPAGGVPRPNASPSGLDAGTYTAGKLKAPPSLNGVALSPATTQEDVKQLRKQRDDFSKAAGGAPAIAANYGQLMNLMQLYGAA